MDLILRKKDEKLIMDV